jgi:hypothetical protein
MDYQLIYGVNGRDANKDYIDIGNYNYGVIAGAAGISPFGSNCWRRCL